MKPEPETISCWVAADHQRTVVPERVRFVPRDEERTYRGRLTLRQLLLRDPIQLGIVESRILRFLASRPYQPCSCQRIAKAVNSDRYPVTESMVDGYVKSLRDQLGFFHDYVQTVRYGGYQYCA